MIRPTARISHAYGVCREETGKIGGIRTRRGPCWGSPAGTGSTRLRRDTLRLWHLRPDAVRFEEMQEDGRRR